MKKSLLALALCGLFIAPAFSQNMALKIIACGEKGLSDEFDIVGQIVISNFTTSNDALAYFGLRYKFNKGFATFLAGHSFRQGGDNSMILGGRALYSLKRVYAWQLVDLSPGVVYTETMFEAILPWEIEIGVEGSSYSQSDAKTVWNLGPNILCKISNRMKFGLTWQKKSAGDNFTRLTMSLNF